MLPCCAAALDPLPTFRACTPDQLFACRLPPCSARPGLQSRRIRWWQERDRRAAAEQSRTEGNHPSEGHNGRLTLMLCCCARLAPSSPASPTSPDSLDHRFVSARFASAARSPLSLLSTSHKHESV